MFLCIVGIRVIIRVIRQWRKPIEYPCILRSRLGSLTDKTVKTAKRWAAEATLGRVNIGSDALENVLHFECLDSRLQCDGDDEADVRHRMDIA